jgi:CHAT domain
MAVFLRRPNSIASTVFRDLSFQMLASQESPRIVPTSETLSSAPGFAEAFFGRGVANFVCTAWPIDDLAALEFARRMYRGLLGLLGPNQSPEPIHESLSAARREIACLGVGGLQTWGAYQHYGDLSFRFFSA